MAAPLPQVPPPFSQPTVDPQTGLATFPMVQWMQRISAASAAGGSTGPTGASGAVGPAGPTGAGNLWADRSHRCGGFRPYWAGGRVRSDREHWPNWSHWWWRRWRRIDRSNWSGRGRRRYGGDWPNRRRGHGWVSPAQQVRRALAGPRGQPVRREQRVLLVRPVPQEPAALQAQPVPAGQAAARAQPAQAALLARAPSSLTARLLFRSRQQPPKLSLSCMARGEAAAGAPVVPLRACAVEGRPAVVGRGSNSQCVPATSQTRLRWWLGLGVPAGTVARAL